MAGTPGRRGRRSVRAVSIASADRIGADRMGADRIGAERIGADRASASFTTLGLPRQERVRAWEQANLRTMRPVRCLTFDADGLTASMRGFRVPGGAVTEIRAGAHVIERVPGEPESGESGVVLLNLLLEGEAYLYTLDGSQSLAAGDATLYEPRSPLLLAFPGAMRQFSIEIPRAVYDEELDRPDPDGRFTVYRSVFSGANGARTRAAAAHLGKLLGRALDAADPAAVREREAALIDLVDLVLGTRLGALSGYVAAAREHIRTHLGDPGLGVGRLAGAVGISERHLERAFAAVGTTVAGAISEARLARARELLTDASRSAVPIAAIATSVGFGSPTGFSRAYRRRYGHSARDERRAAAATGTGTETPPPRG